jgi:hypothetical protein
MGDQVKGNTNLEKGTAIATFGPDGKYAGGHAAIYVGQDQMEFKFWINGRRDLVVQLIRLLFAPFAGMEKLRPTTELFSTSSSELIDAIHQEPRLLFNKEI